MINYHQFELLGVEAKKRLQRSRIILLAFVFPLLGIALIIWVCELFKVVISWAAWPFIAVAFALLAYNHFNMKKSQKLIDKRQEFVNSIKGGQDD